MTTDIPYARDLVGYGPNPPVVRWPNNAKLALSFVLNYEEGGENSIEFGDAHAESFITEVPSASPLMGARSVNTESLYDYGSRAGVWRILRMFDEFDMPLTVYAVGLALEKNPNVAAAFSSAGHEIASHHWRWIDYKDVPEEVEREHVLNSIRVIEQLTGHRPRGWYGGRTSLNSRRLALEYGFEYDNDVYDDDLPHWTVVDGKPFLLVPYTLDNNDFKFSISPGFASGVDWLEYLKGAFNTLYRESDTTPKMMSVGLHCRMAGKPGRAAALRAFLEYVSGFEDVWVCRREEIAAVWRDQHPFNAES